MYLFNFTKVTSIYLGLEIFLNKFLNGLTIIVGWTIWLCLIVLLLEIVDMSINKNNQGNLRIGIFLFDKI